MATRKEMGMTVDERDGKGMNGWTHFIKKSCIHYWLASWQHHQPSAMKVMRPQTYRQEHSSHPVIYTVLLVTVLKANFTTLPVKKLTNMHQIGALLSKIHKNFFLWGAQLTSIPFPTAPPVLYTPIRGQGFSFHAFSPRSLRWDLPPYNSNFQHWLLLTSYYKRDRREAMPLTVTSTTCNI